MEEVKGLLSHSRRMTDVEAVLRILPLFGRYGGV